MAYKILLSGGGTGGPVTPLLAVAQALQKSRPDVEFLWLGTFSGPERELVEKAGIKFQEIASGKFRRYFSWQNFTDLFRIAAGLWSAFRLMGRWRPDIILSAGAFVSVPVIWAGWLRRVPAIIHQPDYDPVLTVRLVAPFVRLVTVSFPETAGKFKPGKALWIGNPTREFLFSASREKALEFFGFDPGRPVLLVTGGGTGASAINKMVVRNLPELLEFTQVLHLTGRGKAVHAELLPGLEASYKQYEFLADEMAWAFAAADVVLSRAGASAIFELAALQKCALLIPMPNSPQVKNAQELAGLGAAKVLNQEEAPAQLVEELRHLLTNESIRLSLSSNMGKLNTREATAKMIKQIWKIIGPK